MTGEWPPVLLIQGPTASGKSAMAVALAERLGGEIINADSMQVYADLRVLTARPSVEEEAEAPHHLYGVIDAGERFSVGAWMRLVLPLIKAVQARGARPILVGGTGLYFKALTEGLAEIPPIPTAIRAAVQARIADRGGAALHGDLTKIDPEAAAAIKPGDDVRIARALEVFEATGERLSSLRQMGVPALPAHAWKGLALVPDRAQLYAAINKRFDTMLAAGALDEAQALIARGLDPLLPCMKAHGAPWLMAHLRGEMSLEAAAALAARDTRRYAKRQFTWLAHQAGEWPRLLMPDLAGRVTAAMNEVG